jgi:hypothetical protein
MNVQITGSLDAPNWRKFGPQLAQTDSWRRYAGRLKCGGVSVPINTVTQKSTQPLNFKSFYMAQIRLHTKSHAAYLRK